MEILTLLKANIRHKKGSFISIVILMTIVSMSLTAILSVKENCITSIENAYEQSGAGDITMPIADRFLTDKLLSSLEEHPMVDRMELYDSVIIDKEEFNGNESTSSWLLVKLYDGIKLFNNDLTAYEDEVPELKSGEIYITQGIQTNMKCDIGDTLKLTTIAGEYEFTVKGFVLEPVWGASVIGFKSVYISDSDYEKMRSEAIAAETDEKFGTARIMHIFKAAGCELTNGQLLRRLNLDTGIADNAFGSLTKDMSIYYTSLFPDIVLSILTVFIGILIVILLIVMGHSISTGIEIDYVNLGVLKSQGFGKGKIRAVFVLQYLFAEIAGTVIGIIPAIPLIKTLGNVFQPITAILAENNIAVLQSLLIILAVLILSGIFVLFITRKVGKISPVRAISGGKNEIYFDSRVKAPICKRGLSASLALRQFTSSKRRYAASVAIVAILVFFMMTINVLGNSVSSKSALESMGGLVSELDIPFKENVSDEKVTEIENKINEYSGIEKKYYMQQTYFSINGDQVICSIYDNPEVTVPLKGRAPKYDNEIAITEILADELDIKIGDKVTVGYRDKKSEYVVSGLIQYINDAGRCFGMSYEGAEKLGFDEPLWRLYRLTEPDKAQELADVLNEEYGDILEAEASEDDIDSTYELAINAMKAVIYVFSVIFALVVVHMVCSKAFIQERTDIGIYKAMGFTSRNLRMQFAMRFLIVSALGSVFGTVLSVLFSGKLLSVLLRSMGITHFAVDFTAFTFAAPIALICVCFFVFAYLVSRKIKKVSVRELVAE